MVLPYICMVVEKTQHLSAVAASLDIEVRGYFADNNGGASPLAPRCVPVSHCSPALLRARSGLLNEPVCPVVI